MAKRSSAPKKRLRRGLWSPEEDEKLMSHIAKYGNGCWSSVPKIAGLERCGKSCRLRWINYLRPDLKRGAFSQEEEDLIIHLHSILGNKWSQIAAQLPGRTDNEVKNFWNTFIKKKLRQRGIDPATHKPLDTEAGSRGAAATLAASRTAVFSDAELILSSAAGQHVAHMPPLVSAESHLYSRSSTDGDGSGGGCSDGSLSLSGYNKTADFAGYLDADALHCGHSGAAHPPPAIIPSVSSSSTLNSMAGLSPGTTTTTTDEHCNNNHSNSSSGGGFESSTQSSNTHLPWLELGSLTSCTDACAGADADHYGAALDELKWSDYVFDGGYQLQYQHGIQGHCIYGDSKDAVPQFDAHGLAGANWC